MLVYQHGLDKFVLLAKQVSALNFQALWRNVAWKYRRTDEWTNTHNDYRMPLELHSLKHKNNNKQLFYMYLLHMWTETNILKPHLLICPGKVVFSPSDNSDYSITAV